VFEHYTESARRAAPAATRQEMLALLVQVQRQGVGPAPPLPDVGDREAPSPIRLSELDRRFLRSLMISAD